MDILTVSIRWCTLIHRTTISSISGISCFTCSSSNLFCNRLAVDRACPVGLDTCRTVHYMTGQSSNYSQTVQYRTAGVTKMCSTRTDCSMQAGCSTWEGRRVCSTCCAASYCNEEIPWGEGDIDMMRGEVGGRTAGYGYGVLCWVVALVTYAVD